ELTVYDLGHRDLVAAGLELEAEVSMADLAAETDAMEPVREHHRTHTCRIRVVVDDDVTIFRLSRLRSRPEPQSDQQTRQQRDAERPPRDHRWHKNPPPPDFNACYCSRRFPRLQRH